MNAYRMLVHDIAEAFPANKGRLPKRMAQKVRLVMDMINSMDPETGQISLVCDEATADLLNELAQTEKIIITDKQPEADTSLTVTFRAFVN